MTNADTARTWDMRVPLEMLAVFVVSMSALGLLLARRGVFDAPPVWILSLLAAGAYGHAARRWQVARYPVPAWHYGLMLAVGLLFRLTPDAYVLGGQDQGVYVNMAMHLANTGSLVPTDRVLEHLTDPGALAIYRQGNYTPGTFLPGVYPTPGGLVFQFYHLFPVWMALFGDGTGPEVAVYGLTFLSLLSLVFAHRLVFLLTGSTRAALAAGLLLAVNPLLAFFSKFPVTEVPTLAFSLMGFAFLADGWRHAREHAAWRLPALGVAAMACVFATRISGFLYMPAVALLGLLGALDTDPVRRRRVVLWAFGTLVAYMASVLYGLRWSHPYSADIYRLTFGKGLARHIRSVVEVGCFGAMLAWVAAARVARDPARRGTIARALQAGARLLPWLGVAIALFGFVQAWRLGYTDAFAGHPWIDQHYGLSHQGLRSLFSTSILVAAVYLSPFLFLAYFPASVIATRPPLQVLLLFTTWCFAIAVVLQPVLAYQPYYARYLASELVPYMTLLVVCAWAALAPRTRGRRLFTAALCAGGLYCAALSAAQIGKSEHEGVAPALDRLAAHFDRGDLILVDASLRAPRHQEIKTALLYVYGLNAATIGAAEMARPEYLDQLDRAFDDVYLVSTSTATPPGFRNVDSVHFMERVFLHGASPPVATGVRSESALRILRYDPTGDVRVPSFSFGQGGEGGDMLGAGWYAPEGWGVWSSGATAVLTLPLDGDPRGHVVELDGRGYVSPRVPVQTVRVSVGDDVLEAKATYPDARVHLQLPAKLTAGSRSVTLRFAFPTAVSPRQLGYSGDARVLAFGLERMRVLPADAPPPVSAPPP